jgi:hypothetical protein
VHPIFAITAARSRKKQPRKQNIVNMPGAAAVILSFFRTFFVETIGFITLLLSVCALNVRELNLIVVSKLTSDMPPAPTSFGTFASIN